MSHVPPTEAAAPEHESQVLTPEQVEKIHVQHSRDLLAFLIGVLRDHELAQDALQQTFQKVAESGGSAREDTLRGWLFQVAYREAMQLRRRQQQDARHLRAFAAMASPEERLATDEFVRDELVTEEEIERLRRAIETLPLGQRQVVQRRIQNEETFAEIAASMNIPLGTALTRMRTAIEKLRKQLNEK